MTYSSDRLDRAEALLATIIEGLARTEANLSRTEKIVESNARAILAYDARIEEGIAEAEEVSSAMAANTRQQVDADRARFDQLHAEETVRFNNLLADARTDRQRAEQRDREYQQRFDAQLAEMRAAREANATEHRAFTQNIQTLLAEIARLWQRVAS